MRLNGYSAVLNVILFILFQQAVDAKNCARPRIANGRAKVRARGKMVYYRCRKKFTRVGAKFAVCLSQGVWSQPPPICIGKGCPNVTPTNGLQIIGEYNGAMLKFSCPAGMKRKGPESIYCNGQTWNVEPPTCVVGISLECDFEDEELCGWGQSDDDHFEWTWLSGATPTINTGPLHDHTFGNNSKKGHYLFIESSAPRKPFDKAILNSPLYQAQYSNSCFEFWYHMQGPDDENAVGSLEVFVKPESKLLDDIDPEFYMDGNQGPEWKRGSITIEQQTEVFQIIIIATRKDAFVSDIAIDDVRMYNCSEDDSASLTTDEITSEAVPTTMTTATSKIITPKTSILASTFKQSTQTTTVTKPKTTTPKTKPTTATLPTTTTTLPTTTTTLSTTTTTLPTTITTIPTTTTSTTLPTTTTTLPTTTTVTRKTTRKSSTTTKPKTRKRTTTQDRTTQTRSTTARTSTKQPETSTKPDSQTTVPLTPSTNKMSKSTIMSNAPTTLKRARHATTTISTAKESPTFRNNSFAGNSQDLSEAGSGNIDDVIGGDNNISSTSNRSQNIPPGSPIKEKTKDSLMPLIIGISCGVVVGLVVIGVAVYLWAKRQQNKTTEESEEEMAPIACAEGGYYNPS